MTTPVCVLCTGLGAGARFVAHSPPPLVARRRPLPPAGSEHKERNEGGVEKGEIKQ